MGTRILLVEDEKQIRDLLVLAFEYEGFEVMAATDGVNALEILEQEDFHVILSDHTMPRMTGLELCRRVKTTMPALPFILFTAHGTFADVPPEVELIRKPAPPAYLIERVRRLVQSRVTLLQATGTAI